MRTTGWAVAGVTTGVVVGLAAGAAAADRDTRRRVASSARLVSLRVGETAAGIGDRVTGTVHDVRDWTAVTALEVRDRVGDTADGWRERSTRSIGRTLLEAVEAFDAALDPLDDEDEPIAG